MAISVKPKSPLGKWSVRFAAVFLLIFILASILTGLGGVDLGPVGPIFGITFGLSGLAALVTGLISIVKNKERSILVFLAVFLGIFALVFILGDILIPH